MDELIEQLRRCLPVAVIVGIAIVGRRLLMEKGIERDGKKGMTYSFFRFLHTN